jgi:hypothetical protein
MPKVFFYAGAGFCVFLALSAAAGLTAQVEGSALTFVAVHGASVAVRGAAGWAILVALAAGLATSTILVRMAALLAARNVFGALFALLSTAATVMSLAWTLLLQARMLMLVRHGIAPGAVAQLHFVALMMLGCFLSLTFLALRPYFSVQASRVLSALVFFPLPLYCLILAQELFVSTSVTAMPSVSPASMVFFAVVAVLFFAIAVHCIRHRHMFIETTNLRELLDTRVDHAAHPIGGVAFDS